MPVRDAHAHGTPSWCDLSSRDLEAAKAFYAALFGWEMHTAPDPEAGGYTMALLHGKAAAALMPQQQDQIDIGIPPHWKMYITVDDVDSMPAKVEAAGGSVMAPPFDVMTAGRMMVAVDRGGAVVCLWEAGENIGSEIVNEPGAFTWAELYTGDPPNDVGFYEQVLGMTSEAADLGSPMPMMLLKVADEDMATVFPLMDANMPPHWMPYFAVEDCDAAMAEVHGLGGQVVMGPMDIQPGRFAVVTDPEGAAFAVIALNQPGD